MTNTQTQPTNERPSDEVTEEWRAVLGYEGSYEVSNRGRVRSLDRYVNSPSGKRFSKGRVIKLGNRAYPFVQLFRDNKCKGVQVHRLVAIAFIENDRNMPIINHINHNPQDNRVENLEWCDYRHNMLHAVRAGRVPMPSERYATKLDREKVQQIRAMDKEGIPRKEIANKFGITPAYISELVSYRKWKDTP